MMHRQMHKEIRPKHDSSLPLADFLKMKGTILQHSSVYSLIQRELCRSRDPIPYILPHQIAMYLPTSLSSPLMWTRNDTELIFVMLTIDMCWCCRAGFYQALLNRSVVCLKSARQRAATQPRLMHGKRAQPFRAAFQRAPPRCPPEWVPWHDSGVISNCRNNNSWWVRSRVKGTIRHSLQYLLEKLLKNTFTCFCKKEN